MSRLRNASPGGTIGAAALHRRRARTNANGLLTMARAALAADRFLEAKGLLVALHAILPRDALWFSSLRWRPTRASLPDSLTALKEAHGYLQTLDPDSTNDPETLGLWGAVHKRLWDSRRSADIWTKPCFVRAGFFLKQDYYNGINLAFLMDVRASLVDAARDRAEAVADAVLARRVDVTGPGVLRPGARGGEVSAAHKSWIMATKWEAAVGLEDPAHVAEYRAEAERMPVAGWMLDSTRSQVARLEELIARCPLRHGALNLSTEPE